MPSVRTACFRSGARTRRLDRDPAQALGKPFLFSVNVANSVGERGLYASQMGPDAMAEWRRVGNQVQLVALNNQFRAEGDARAVEQAFSPSLLAASSAASAEHPERKSFLVDASFLLADIPGYSTRSRWLTACPTRWTRANSFIRGQPCRCSLSTLTARMHFATRASRPAH
jgi:hypothetical protein